MLHGEIEAQQEPARRNVTSESEHSVRLGSLKGSSARAPAEAGSRSVGKRPRPLRQNPSSLLAPVTQKRLALVIQAKGAQWHLVSS